MHAARFEDCRPILLGLKGLTLDDEEKMWLERIKPLGVLLFGRNISSKRQTQDLCNAVADFLPKVCTSDDRKAPLIAVDQEGGRVQRLSFNGRRPPAAFFGEWYTSHPAQALRGAYLNGILLASDLAEVGATWVMGPCVDLSYPETHAIIGNRAYSSNADMVYRLAEKTLEGIEAAGCLGCLKHAPGHGRAATDSHQELPRVNASAQEMAIDWLPYQKMAPGLKNSPFLMTAHITYPNLQQEHLPATWDSLLLKQLRDAWSFKGLWVADDLGMQALTGSYVERAVKSLDVGCEVLICSFSNLVHGMAGTVFDMENFDSFANSIDQIPYMTHAAATCLTNLNLNTPLTQTQVVEIQDEFNALCAATPEQIILKYK